MTLIDCHVHSVGNEKVDDVIASMDKNGVDKAIIFAPYPGRLVGEMGVDQKPTSYLEFSYQGVTEEAQRRSTEFISKLQTEAPDRIIAFAWIEPRLKNAVRNVEEAVTKFECRGIKMIPDHWYPYDQKFFNLYEKIQELKVPVLFHSGILCGFKDSSRFCRPCNYEVMINFPRLKFALAHMSWPWIDECISLFGRFRANVRGLLAAARDGEIQMYIDITPETPKFYRRDALSKALAYGAENHLMFGSDSLASNIENAKYICEMDRSILRELGYSDEVIEKIQHKNVERYLKP